MQTWWVSWQLAETSYSMLSLLKEKSSDSLSIHQFDILMAENL